MTKQGLTLEEEQAIMMDFDAGQQLPQITFDQLTAAMETINDTLGHVLSGSFFGDIDHSNDTLL